MNVSLCMYLLNLGHNEGRMFTDGSNRYFEHYSPLLLILATLLLDICYQLPETLFWTIATVDSRSLATSPALQRSLGPEVTKPHHKRSVLR